MTGMLDGICGRIAPGLCRLSMDGSIAVKTGAGYRAYNPKTGRLTNCDSFVLDIGEDFFFVVPVNKVRSGDIILVGGRPRCVVKAEENTVTVINYEDMTVETLLPEYHSFMGNTYLFGCIVSMFGKNGAKGKKSAGKMMKYMMLSSVLKGQGGSGNSWLPLLLMGGFGEGNVLDGLFETEEETEMEKGA